MKYLIYILIFLYTVLFGYVDYNVYGNIYHTLLLILIISINYSIYRLTSAITELFNLLKRWLNI